MKVLPKTTMLIAPILGLVFAVGCSAARTPTPTGTARLAITAVPQQTEPSTAVAIPTDLAFSTPLVQSMNQSGVDVLSVRGSTFASMFQSTSEAAWIETNQGIVDVVFLATPDEASDIRIMQSPNAPAGRYIYILQAPSPTLLHDQTIDAAFPLYFTVGHGMLMVTSSHQLDQSLKRLFAER